MLGLKKNITNMTNISIKALLHLKNTTDEYILKKVDAKKLARAHNIYKTILAMVMIHEDVTKIENTFQEMLNEIYV
jgi:hypothetical protein